MVFPTPAFAARIRAEAGIVKDAADSARHRRHSLGGDRRPSASVGAVSAASTGCHTGDADASWSSGTEGAGARRRSIAFSHPVIRVALTRLGLIWNNMAAFPLSDMQVLVELTDAGSSS